MGRWIKNWFSNYERLDYPIECEGMFFHTVEAFYQANKIPRENAVLRKKVSEMDPASAKRFCSFRSRNFVLRPDWEQIKIEVMRYALNIKFGEGTYWRRRLKETEGLIIEHNNWHDNIWGDCNCPKCKRQPGQNLLGRLLMEIRDNE